MSCYFAFHQHRSDGGSIKPSEGPIYSETLDFVFLIQCLLNESQMYYVSIIREIF